MAASPPSAHIGIGGWDYDPWRQTFYPPGLPKTKQLQFASRQVNAIEINATFYKLQRPELFERWADAVPDGFVFAVKGSRFCTNRKVLGEAAEAIARFCGQGFTRLGPKLGPILWQFAETKKFDPEDVAAFLALLPREQDGMKLRHVIEAEHESFRDSRFADMAGEAQVAICLVDNGGEAVADLDTAPFVYARLKNGRSDEASGYSEAELDAWAQRVEGWISVPKPRETFLFFIGGAKERNPAAAKALAARLEGALTGPPHYDAFR
jgi:uncharacterized protein YecE (DUF72 family)